MTGPLMTTERELEEAVERLTKAVALNELSDADCPVQPCDDVRIGDLRTVLRALSQPYREGGLAHSALSGSIPTEQTEPAVVGEWIEWAGGKNPVPGKTVEVKLRWRNGEPSNGSISSEHMDWTHRSGRGGDIVAYRIVQNQNRKLGGDEAEGEVNHLQAQLKAAYEALEPFAKAAEKMDGDERDDMPIWGSSEALSIQFGDLRRAHSVYSQGAGQ